MTEDAPDEAFIDTLGRPESMITTTVDVQAFVGVKRASMAAHASQINESSFFLQLPEEAFAASFGFEWFIDRSPAGEHRSDDLFAGLGD